MDTICKQNNLIWPSRNNFGIYSC